MTIKNEYLPLIRNHSIFLGKSKKNSYSSKNKSVKQNGGKAVPKTKGDLKLNIIT